MKGSWVRVPFSAFFFCLKMPPDSILTAFLLYCNIFFYCFSGNGLFFTGFLRYCFLYSYFFCSNLFCTFLLWCCLAGGLFGSCRFLRCYCQFLRLFARCAGKNSHTQCRKLKGNRIFSFITICLFAGFCPYVYYSLSAIFFAVTVEDLFVFSSEWNTHLIILIWNCSKITYRKKCFFRIFCFAKECQDIFFIFHKLDPFKSFIIIIHE